MIGCLVPICANCEGLAGCGEDSWHSSATQQSSERNCDTSFGCGTVHVVQVVQVVQVVSQRLMLGGLMNEHTATALAYGIYRWA